MSEMQVGKPHLRDIHVPAPLRDMPLWLVWAYEQHLGESKARKVPQYSMGGRRHGQQGSPADLAKLTTFAVARDAAVRRGMDGVGFAHTEAGGIVTLDFDNCVHDGVVAPQVLDLVKNTYAEFSPSGKGVHAIFSASHDVLGNPKSPATAEQFGVEAFSSKGFTTFSGWMLDHVDILGYEDRVAPLPKPVIEFCQTRFGVATSSFDPDDFMAGREPRLGLTVDYMADLLSALDPDMGREDWIKVGMGLHHECEGDDTGFELWHEWSAEGGKYPSEEALRQQWDSFDRHKASGRRQVTMASVIKMAKDAGGMSSPGDWPTPSPLPEALLPVPAMVREMLPKELAPWLTDIAERMSVPLDFVAIPAMVMLGALIGGKVEVRPQEKTDWSEPANLWGAIVASPGAMKSPVVNQVFAPIKKLEAEAQSRNKEVLEKHRVDCIVSKTRLDAATNSAKKNAGASTPDELAELLMGFAVEPPKPKLKRYITTDATVEKLGEICADNPNGILYHRDELPTLFADLQREEKAPVRGFMLTGWAGTGSYTFDRIARGTTHIESVNISLFGTAQPQRIANLVSVSAAKHDDGMIQRLQLLVWPDFVDEWIPADRVPDADARDAAFACCQRLSALNAADIDVEIDEATGATFLRLHGDARAIFETYRAGLEAKVRSRSLPEPLAAHLAKYRGMVPRLALILHLAGGGHGRIASDAMGAAIEWAHYLEAHAQRMYASADIAISGTAGLILRRIRNGELCDGFSQRDITQKDWSGLRDAGSVGQALTTLQEYGWLRSQKTPTSGRPKEIFHINPAALSTAASQ